MSTVVVLLLEIVAAGVFLMAGIAKLAGAILLLIPRVAVIGAALLAVTMVGAIVTHVFIIGGSPAVPIALLMITSVVAWQRRAALATEA